MPPPRDPAHLNARRKRGRDVSAVEFDTAADGVTPAAACRPTTMSKLPRWKSLPVSGVIVRPAVETGSPKMKSSMTTTSRSPVSSGPGAALPLMMRTRATSSPVVNETPRNDSDSVPAVARHETLANQAPSGA